MNDELTTDLRWLYARTRAAMWRVQFDLYIILGAIVLMGLMAAGHLFVGALHFAYAIFMLSVFRFVQTARQKTLLSERWNADCDYFRARLPKDLLRAAQAMAPDSLEALFWAIECNESHLAGDCPLCGAK